MNYSLSKKSFSLSILLSLLLFFAACGAKPETEKPVEPPPKVEKKIMKIRVDLEEQKKSQEASDQGFRIWKNKVTDVAEECIIGKGIGAPSSCEVIAEGEKEASVRVRTQKDGTFRVKLERLVRPGGIWTATEVAKESE